MAYDQHLVDKIVEGQKQAAADMLDGLAGLMVVAHDAAVLHQAAANLRGGHVHTYCERVDCTGPLGPHCSVCVEPMPGREPLTDSTAPGWSRP